MHDARQVLVVRHAIAEDAEAAARSGIEDSARALTQKGVRRMAQASAGLRVALDGIDVIFHSPLRRARQTADIVAECFAGVAREECGALAPGTPSSQLYAWLLSVPVRGPMALVGHEPDLGLWISRSLAGGERGFVPMKKGGACLLAFHGGLAPGRATLSWLLPPRVLRRLA